MSKSNIKSIRTFGLRDPQTNEIVLVTAWKVGTGEWWRATCPRCQETSNEGLSISIAKGFHCFRDCGFKGGSIQEDVEQKPLVRPSPALGEPVAVYEYYAANKTFLFQMVKYVNAAGKTMRAYRPNPDWKLGDPEKDQWLNEAGGHLEPYHLPELIGSDDNVAIYLCEGERDCDTLEAKGLIATTNPFGACHWKEEYSKWLKGRDVIFIPDCDEEGHRHKDKTIPLLGKVKSLTVIDLKPHLPEGKKDVTDFFESGKDLDDLLNIIAGTEPTTKGAEAASPHKSQGLFEILAEPKEETNSIIDPIFQEGDKSILIATWKLGKTLLDTQLALCVSKPNSFLGYSVAESRNVLYVRFELKKSRFKARLHQMVNGVKHKFEKVPRFDLYRGFDLLKQECADWLYSEIEQNEIGFLIMEPMYKMFGVALNKPESAEPVLRALEKIQIRFPKIHIHIAHHERRLPAGLGKGETDERGRVYGPMQIYADFDWQLFLTSDKNDNDPIFNLSFLSNDIDINPISLKRDPDTLLYYPVDYNPKSDLADLKLMWKILTELVEYLKMDSNQKKFADACSEQGIKRKKFDRLDRLGLKKKMWSREKKTFWYYKPLPAEGWN